MACARHLLNMLDKFTLAYIECALWSSLDDSDDCVHLDANYGLGDIAPATIARMVEDCEMFQAQNMEDIEEDLGRAGHDFWLTRNHHSIGFWDGDRWEEEAGERLTQESEEFGEFDLYMGDDGFLHHF